MLKEGFMRHEEVLAIIVKHYVETAEPVGSRFVSRQLDLSSATIRNVMADLEDLGFITHPHTSAGRIPTDKGYRYYIDSIMRVKAINEHIIRSINDECNRTLRSLEDFLERGRLRRVGPGRVVHPGPGKVAEGAPGGHLP